MAQSTLSLLCRRARACLEPCPTMKMRLRSLVLIAGLHACLQAQLAVTEEKKLETKFVADRAALSGALVRRANLAAEIAGGGTNASAGLARLRSDSAASGLKVPADAGYAFAAIDVGQRLLAFGKHAEAERFFQAAESALGEAIRKTPDEAASEKSQYLANLGFIRARFLNKAAAAKADFAAAQRLNPHDKVVDGLAKASASRNREVFDSNPSKKD